MTSAEYADGFSEGQSDASGGASGPVNRELLQGAGLPEYWINGYQAGLDSVLTLQLDSLTGGWVIENPGADDQCPLAGTTYQPSPGDFVAVDPFEV